MATRLPSGHRRYTQQDVDAIIQVGREREAGLSLEAAIERTRNRRAPRPARSIFADLRAASPDLTPHMLSKRSMLAISRAIEDEFCARAERPLLIGSFQREEFYLRSAERWRSLADTAAAAVVMADFVSPRPPTTRPIELGLDANPALQREWTIVCDAPDSAACLVGWERPGQTATPDADRMFEAIWTAEPPVVRQASHIGLDLITRQAPATEPTVRAPRSARHHRSHRRAAARHRAHQPHHRLPRPLNTVRLRAPTTAPRGQAASDDI